MRNHVQFANLKKSRGWYKCTRCGHKHHGEVSHCGACNSKIIKVYTEKNLEAKELDFRRGLTEGARNV